MSRDTKNLDAVVGVVSSLIKAGANVHEAFNVESTYKLRSDYSGPVSYTIFDLGVFTGSIEVVNILISAGAHITLLSVEYGVQFQSFDVFKHLVLAGASVSTKATITATNHQAHLTETYNTWIKEVALLKAIHLGHVSTIEYLLNDGTFRFDDILLDKSSAITKAIESCCSGGHIRALRFILQNNPKCRVSLSPWFGDSLYLATWKRRDEVIDTLLSAGANVNTMGAKGQTPLFAAIMTGNKKVLQRLMSMGAILNPRAAYAAACFRVHGVSGDALITAIRQGDSDVVNCLLEWGADTEAFGIDHLHERSANIEAYGITDPLLRHPCYCVRPITAALIAKNSDLVNDLIRRGAKIKNPLDGYSPTPRSRMTPLAAAIRIRDPEMVNFIIREGANLEDPMAIKVAISDQELHWARAILFSHLRDTKSESMLSFALAQAMERCSDSDFDIIRMLLSFGADPNTVLFYGVGPTRLYTDFWKKGSAIAWAARKGNSLQLVKILLEAGAKADTDAVFAMQYSPLQSAIERRDQALARILLDYGSNPDFVPMESSSLVDHRSPLQIAVKKHDVEMIGVLFQYRADPNGAHIGRDWTDFDSELYYLPRTPLQEASMNGSKEIVEILLEHGADVNSPPVTGNGATALQYAAMYGFLGIAHLLLEHDADVNAPAAETDGRTALEGAAEHGRLDMVQLLLNAGANIFGDGQVHYENALRRASGNGHHAIRRMLEKWHSDRE